MTNKLQQKRERRRLKRKAKRKSRHTSKQTIDIMNMKNPVRRAKRLAQMDEARTKDDQSD